MPSRARRTASRPTAPPGSPARTGSRSTPSAVPAGAARVAGVRPFRARRRAGPARARTRSAASCRSVRDWGRSPRSPSPVRAPYRRSGRRRDGPGGSRDASGRSRSCPVRQRPPGVLRARDMLSGRRRTSRGIRRCRNDSARRRPMHGAALLPGRPSCRTLDRAPQAIAQRPPAVCRHLASSLYSCVALGRPEHALSGPGPGNGIRIITYVVAVARAASGLILTTPGEAQRSA